MGAVGQVKSLDGEIILDSHRDELYKKYRSKFNKRAALFQHAEVTSKACMVFNVMAGLALVAGAGFVLHETQAAIPLMNMMMGCGVVAGLAKVGFAVKPVLDQRSYRRAKTEMDDLRAQINTAFPDTIWKEALDTVDVSNESPRVQMSFIGDLPFAPEVKSSPAEPSKNKFRCLVGVCPV